MKNQINSAQETAHRFAHRLAELAQSAETWDEIKPGVRELLATASANADMVARQLDMASLIQNHRLRIAAEDDPVGCIPNERLDALYEQSIAAIDEPPQYTGAELTHVDWGVPADDDEGDDRG